MASEGAYSYQPARSITITTTGNIDDLDVEGAAVLYMNNASTSTIRGIGAGFHGQQLAVVSIGAGKVDLAHQNAGSLAASRLINFVTSGVTPLSAGTGGAIYSYDAPNARWRLIGHVQGAWQTPTFSALDYTANASAWTVAAGDVLGNSFEVSGKSITRAFNIVTTTVVAGSNELRVFNPNGYTAASRVFAGGVMNDNGVASNGYLDTKAAANTYVGFFLNSGANWAAAVDNTAALSSISFELT